MQNPADRLTLRTGTMRDYAELAEFHYLRHAPVTATRVLVLTDPTPSIADRFIPRATGRDREGVAVLVESYPALSCVLRDRATHNRYAGWSDRSAAARLLNAEIRCISRVIVHPQWRGLGLAVRLVRHALATAETIYTEALAAMGRVHPFFALAGMTRYERPPHARDQRLIDALRYARREPWALANTSAMRGEVESSPLLRRELRRWSGPGLTLDEQLTKARDRLLCEPVYFLHRRLNRQDAETPRNTQKNSC